VLAKLGCSVTCSSHYCIGLLVLNEFETLQYQKLSLAAFAPGEELTQYISGTVFIRVRAFDLTALLAQHL
jgi:hypothetical protein